MTKYGTNYKSDVKNSTKQLLLLTVSISSIMLSACTATTGGKNNRVDASTSTVNYSESLLDIESINELADLLEAKNMDMVENNQADIIRMGNLWDRVRSGFRLNHLQYNSRIEAQKNWFITRQKYLDRLTARASRYLYHTVREAERQNIPTELALLPVIESSYDPSATSNASAAGLWQFIPSTGKMYGLSVTSDYDGRRDVIESTRAAYEFLTALHNRFGSWELALAAYNCGPGCVQRAINKNEARGLSTDFWSLKLPTETMNYVPRFLAVSDIVANPSKHGVYLSAIANQQHFRTVPVTNGVSLYQVSNQTGISIDELQNLNPGLTFGQIVSHAPQRVVIPNSISVNVDKQILALGSGKVSVSHHADGVYIASNQPLSVASNESSFNYNDDLYNKASLPTNSNDLANYAQSAAIHNSVTHTATAAINDKPTLINEPPLTANEISTIYQDVANSKPQLSTAINTNVQDGNKINNNESAVIAKSLNNKINSNIDKKLVVNSNTQSIKIDQKKIEDSVLPVTKTPKNIKLDDVKTQTDVLESKGEEKKLVFSSQNNKSTTSNKPKGKRSSYTVKRGDTLLNIANRAGVNWREIAEWNQMSPNATLLAGSTLYLYNAKPIKPLVTKKPNITSEKKQKKPKFYIVKAGDTLIGTANKLGLRPSQLANYNGMTVNDNLRIGQKLWLVDGQNNSNMGSKVSKNTPKNNQAAIKTQNYKVTAGDTLFGIAHKFNTTSTIIANLNGFESNYHVQLGQFIKVPNNSSVVNPAHTSSTKPSTTTNSNNLTTKYKVKSGDTLLGVANKFKIRPSLLATTNDLSISSGLKIGQTLKIPLAGTANKNQQKTSTASDVHKINPSRMIASTYKVKAGDSLINLAKRYHISLATLAKANNLTSHSELKIGQSLKIPATTVEYKIKSGDTLIGLARKQGISVNQLADLNNIQPDKKLKIGETIKLPIR